QATGNLFQQAVAGVMAKAVVHFLKVVNVNQIEDQVAVIAAVIRDVVAGGPRRLTGVRRDRGIEKPAIADSGERIAERDLLEFLIGLGQRGTAFGHRFLKPLPFLLVPQGAVLGEYPNQEYD